jgi:DNA-binding IclR family transcriptional regulator
VPVRGPDSTVVAAVNLAVLSSLVSTEDLVDRLARTLTAAAGSISTRIGWRPGR